MSKIMGLIFSVFITLHYNGMLIIDKLIVNCDYIQSIIQDGNTTNVSLRNESYWVKETPKQIMDACKK